jgi:hypothetical protein
MNIEEFKKQIEVIISSVHHDGEYGHTTDINNFPNEFIESYFVESYLEFLTKFGYGELDSSFYVEEQPLKWSEVFPKERDNLEGLFIFATDQGEYCYAFDSKDSYKVVEISADGELSESSLGDFQQFISKKLNELVDIVSWRNENL